MAECCGPKLFPAPPAVRMVTGTEVCPPDMNASVAMSLTMLSAATCRNSANMISTTGRQPVTAMPVAMPDEAVLGDRRVDHAVGELREQAVGDLEHAAGLADVLADEHDAVVGAPSRRAWRARRPRGRSSRRCRPRWLIDTPSIVSGSSAYSASSSTVGQAARLGLARRRRRSRRAPRRRCCPRASSRQDALLDEAATVHQQRVAQLPAVELTRSPVGAGSEREWPRRR